MLKPSVGVALEGLPYIIIAAFTTLVFAIIDCWPMAMIGPRRHRVHRPFLP